MVKKWWFWIIKAITGNILVRSVHAVEHTFENFKTEENNGFSEDLSIDRIVKTDPSDHLHVYVSGHKWSTNHRIDTHDTQISQKQGRYNIYLIMKKMCPPS